MHFSTIATLCGVIAPTIAAPQSGVNNPHPSRPDTGKWPGYSPGSASTELSFYMCCQGSPESPGIDHYYPPYACIFGPAKGECPQGATSSFPYAWLCTYQSAEFAIDCIYESGPSSSLVTAGVLRPVLNAVGGILGNIGL